MDRRVVFLIGVFVVCATTTYFIVKPNPKKQIEKAFQDYQLSKYSEAEEALVSLPNSFYPSLYKGYIEQGRKRLDLADFHFNVASQEAKKGGDREKVMESLLARSANAYWEKQDEDFFSLLETAHTTQSEHAALPFFLGLESYLHQEYGEALQLWHHFLPHELGQWMASSLELLFPSCWRKVHMAHCLIEEGDILQGRELLEKESRLAQNDADRLSLATLFLGLSYLKESHKVALDQRGSYYQLAHFYFERAQVKEPFAREKNVVIIHVEKETEELLLADLDDEKRKWGFDFVHTLQDWKAKTSIERLAALLADKMLKQRGEECVSLCEAIRNEFHGSPFHLLITEKILSSLTQELKRGETEDLFDLWALIEPLSPNPKLSAKQLASLTRDEIFETVKKDNLELTRTRNFISFWEKLGRNSSEKELLAADLIFQAKLFWQNDKQEKKGHRLMEMALQISNYNPLIEKEIALFLTALYAQAESSNMIRRLTLIYNAMEHFQINRQDLVSKATLANHLADAEYLFKARNYLAAKTHANWVLKLDPQNESARRLAGLSAFHLGEYGKSLHYLKEVSQPDEETCKALMLCQAFASQEQGRHLCQNEALDCFDDNE